MDELVEATRTFILAKEEARRHRERWMEAQDEVERARRKVHEIQRVLDEAVTKEANGDENDPAYD